MLLAGDIGGTNARLGLFRREGARPILVHTRVFPTSGFPTMVGMLEAFCAEHGLAPRSLEGAAFGVAGPVLDDVVTLTNANWTIDGHETARALGLDHVRVVNDLAAIAMGVTVLTAQDYVVLQDRQPDPRGNIAIVAPGTGLGEGLLHNERGRLLPSPSEGGHGDLAPHNEREIELLRFITARFGRATWEHVLSGPGLLVLSDFTHEAPCRVVNRAAADAPSQVTASALNRSCPRCVEVLQLFVDLLGAEAGNHAIRTVSTGGMYIGGGIPPRVLPVMQDGRFLKAFLRKDPQQDLVERMPVRLITHQFPGLLGAAVIASS